MDLILLHATYNKFTFGGWTFSVSHTVLNITQGKQLKIKNVRNEQTSACPKCD
jgi:hypothetical protein